MIYDQPNFVTAVQCNFDCPSNCPKVCGTDGQVYCNSCKLKLHACETKNRI